MTELEKCVEIRKRARKLYHRGLAIAMSSAQILECEGLYIDIEYTDVKPTLKEIIDSLTEAFINYEEKQ